MALPKTLESARAGTTAPLDDMLDALKYNADGLIPAIAQDAQTAEVLMVAWMNRQAIEETLATGQVCYWSRSRATYWRKGETSGHWQKLVEMRLDCDADTLLLQVTQEGPACHTDRRSCFYLKVEGAEVRVTDDPG